MTQYVNPQSIDPYASGNPTHNDVSFYDTPDEIIGRLQNREVAKQLYQQAVQSGQQNLQENQYKLMGLARDNELESDPAYQDILRRSKMAGQQQVISSQQATDISNRNKVLSTAAQYLAAAQDPVTKAKVLAMTRQQYPGFIPDDDMDAEQYLNTVQESYKYNPEFMQKSDLANAKYEFQQQLQDMKAQAAQQLLEARLRSMYEVAIARMGAARENKQQPNTPLEYMISAFRRERGREPNLQELQQLQGMMPQNNPQVQQEKAYSTTTGKKAAELESTLKSISALKNGLNPNTTSTVSKPVAPAPVQTTTKPKVIKLD